MKNSMMILIAFLLLDLTARAQATELRNLSVVFNEIYAGSEQRKLVIAVIRPVKATPSAAENAQLANELLSIAHNWSLNQIRDRYTHHPAEKFEFMRRAGVNLTENSSFIIVFDPKEPAKPLGTLWAAYPDENGKVDLEKSLNWQLPKKSLRFADYPAFKSQFGKILGIRSVKVAQEGAIELKRLVLDPAAPRELMPTMLLRGESLDRLNTQPLRYAEGPDGRQAVLPADYVLRCDRNLLPIYRRFGFKLASEEAIQNDYVMRVSRVEYMDSAMKWLKKSRATGWEIEADLSQTHKTAQIESMVRANLKARACEAAF